MKRWLYLLLVSVLAQAVQAQPNARYAGAPDEVGANYRVWRGSQTGAQSKKLLPQMDVYTPDLTAGNTGGGVVEIASGMNYWDGIQWVPSDPTVTATEDGFAAYQIQHQVYLYKELNGADAVNLTMPDGLQLKSTPVALALSDPTSGQTLVIAQLTNTVGTLINSNQVWYRDAFQGGVNADIVYTVERGSFEQDVVLTSRLDPTEYGFPTNSRLQILTEFYNAPTPTQVRRPLYVEQNEQVRQQKVSPDLIDEVLGFHGLFMGTGRVFTMPSKTSPKGVEAVVAKQFATVNGRTFLIETVDSGGIRQELKQLPEAAGNAAVVMQLRQAGQTRRGYEFVPRPQLLARAPVPTQQPVGVQLAFAERPTRPEVVVDYVANISGTGPTVFRGDTTYHVTGNVYCYSAVTIEGGAVFKYDAGYSITLSSTVTCNTSSYRPAIFTAKDDNTVGEAVGTGSPGSNRYANPALILSYISAPTLSNIRVAYAQEGVRIASGASVTANIAHSQFVNCLKGIVLIGSGSSGSSGFIYLTVKNALFVGVGSPFWEGSGSGSGISGWTAFYSCTFAQSQAVFTAHDYYYMTVKTVCLPTILILRTRTWRI